MLTTDIYATGAVLFELLTGRRLYEHPGGEHRALARRIIRGQHSLPSAHALELAQYDMLVARALAPDPAQRFQNAASLRDALQEALVRIHPTLSSEHLGMFVRQLFAGEMAALRQLAARAQGADLGPWKAQLAQRSPATISIALSPQHTRELHLSSGAAGGGEPVGLAPRPIPTARPGPAPLVPRRRVAVWGGVATLFFAGGAVLAALLVDPATAPGTDSALTGPGAAPDGAPGPLVVVAPPAGHER